MTPNLEHTSASFQVDGAKADFVLIICSMLWMVNFMVRQVMSIVLEPMKLSLGLSDSQAGWITTSLFIAMALFATPISYWVDRWSRRKAIGLMAIIWSIAMILTGISSKFWNVFISRLLTGAALAGFSAAATSLISASFAEETRAKKMGIFNLFQMFGIFTSLIAGGILSSSFGGWQTPFLFFSIPGFIIGSMAFYMQDYKSPSPDLQSNLIYNIKRVLRIKSIAWFYAGYTLYTAVTMTVLTWIPTLIIRRFEVGEDTAGLIMSITGAFALPSVLISGVMADRWQQKHPAGRMKFATLLVFTSVVLIQLALLSIIFLHQGEMTHLSPWLIIGMVSLFLFSAIAAAINPPVMAASQTVVSKELRGLVWGMGVALIMIFGGAWSPAAAGYLSDYLGGGVQGLTKSILIVSLLGFGGFACFVKSSTHYQADIEKLTS